MIFRKSRDKAKKPKVNYHPWRRFYARSIDLFLVSFILVASFLFVLGILMPRHVGAAITALKNPLFSGVMVYLLWIPLEAFFLSTMGATPGKWLFGIEVMNRLGNNLTYSNALRRTLLVWFKGDGLGISLVAFFTRLFAYKRLKKTGTTLWDTSVHSVVTHKEFTFLRTAACVLALVAVSVITLYLSLKSGMAAL